VQYLWKHDDRDNGLSVQGFGTPTVYGTGHPSIVTATTISVMASGIWGSGYAQVWAQKAEAERFFRSYFYSVPANLATGNRGRSTWAIDIGGELYAVRRHRQTASWGFLSRPQIVKKQPRWDDRWLHLGRLFVSRCRFGRPRYRWLLRTISV